MESCKAPAAVSVQSAFVTFTLKSSLSLSVAGSVEPQQAFQFPQPQQPAPQQPFAGTPMMATPNGVGGPHVAPSPGNAFTFGVHITPSPMQWGQVPGRGLQTLVRCWHLCG